MRLIKLTHGQGNGINKACLMTASNMLIGKGQDGDKNSCVCPVIRKFIILTNDKMPESLLGEIYGPLIWEILGTKTDDIEVMRQRAYLFADTAVREFTPFALEKAGFNEHATKLRNLSEIIDKNTAKLAKTAARAAAADAAAVDYAADAAYVAVADAARAVDYAAVDYAADAAYVAVDAAYVAVDAAYVAAARAAAYAAAAAAYAANANAANAYADARWIWERCAELILAACKIGDKRPVEPCLTENQLCEMLG